MSSSKARFFNPAVVGLIMLSFFLGTSEYTVIGILPEIADGFGISLTQAGSIVSLFAFAYGLGTPFLAAYVGKYNRFRITMLGISLFALCNLICAIATNYMVFLVFRILTAVVSGTVVSISMTYGGRCCFHPGAYPRCDRRCFFRASVSLRSSVCLSLPPSLMFLDGVRLLSRSLWRLWLCWRFCL